VVRATDHAAYGGDGGLWAGPYITGVYELIILPSGASGADDMIRPLRGWQLDRNRAPDGLLVLGGVAANPFNQDEWLLWGVDNSSPLELP